MTNSLNKFLNNSQLNQEKRLLIVEDSEYDVEAFLRITKKLPVEFAVYHCCDGDDALNFLYHQEQYQDQKKYPQPSLILLDLNLPGTDGREVLNIIKQDNCLKKIPVVVFTSSSNPKDIEYCYEHGANTYILKPMGNQQLKKVIDNLFVHWFDLSVLPESVLMI